MNERDLELTVLRASAGRFASLSCLPLPLFLGLFAGAAFLTGCFTVRVNAPPNSNIVLGEGTPRSATTVSLTSDPVSRSTATSRSKRNIYLVSGLLPIGNNSTADLMPIDCSRASFTTEMSFLDGLITVGSSMALSVAYALVYPTITGQGISNTDLTVYGAGLAATQLLAVPHARTTTVHCTERRSAPLPTALVPAVPTVPAAQGSTGTPLPAQPVQPPSTPPPGATPPAAQPVQPRARYCVSCGKTLPEGVRFCPDCGAPVQPAEGQ